MPQPFTVVTLVDEEGDEFPIRLPGVYPESSAGDIEAALDIANRDREAGFINPTGKLICKEIHYN